MFLHMYRVHMTASVGDDEDRGMASRAVVGKVILAHGKKAAEGFLNKKLAELGICVELEAFSLEHVGATKPGLWL